MRQAHIFYKDQLAGILTENDAGYEFRYLPEYLSLEKAKEVSMTLPFAGGSIYKSCAISIFRRFDSRRMVVGCCIAEYRHQYS